MTHGFVHPRVSSRAQRGTFAVALKVPRCARDNNYGLRTLCVLLLLLFTFPAFAVEPSEMLPDPALEARARDIGRALRCVVCQNQSIDDSSAEVARDMRRAVRERLTAGDSDGQIYDFMVARYGDYVLLRPPFRWGTLLLWLGAPVLLLLAGGALLWGAQRHYTAEAPKLLTDAELQRVVKLLEAGIDEKKKEVS